MKLDLNSQELGYILILIDEYFQLHQENKDTPFYRNLINLQKQVDEALTKEGLGPRNEKVFGQI